MFRVRIVSLVVVLACLLGLGAAVYAAEVSSDAVYCFSGEDFSQSQDTLQGICIMELPDPSAGTVMLGVRVLQPGDFLTQEQISQMTFHPIRTQEDTQALVTFLPIYTGRVEKANTVTISIRGKEDKAPVAQDFSLETYKNLPNEGKLPVTDPEGQNLTYTVTRQPRRGQVQVNEDGTFTYTPKKNKVGVDSFTYTATDPAGHVSREATVTVQILKPTDSRQYSDTVGMDCRFEAEWMRNTGLFVGESIGDSVCFQPEKAVSRGEFVAMVLKVLQIPVEETGAYTQLAQDAPQWLKPYIAAAVRSGLLAGWSQDTFGADMPISGEEAALLLQNALQLQTQNSQLPTDQTQAALAVMQENGFGMLSAAENLCRGDMALLMYRVYGLSGSAPGVAVFRSQD